jgi:hypothetical protein
MCHHSNLPSVRPGGGPGARQAKRSTDRAHARTAVTVQRREHSEWQAGPGPGPLRTVMGLTDRMCVCRKSPAAAQPVTAGPSVSLSESRPPKAADIMTVGSLGSVTVTVAVTGMTRMPTRNFFNDADSELFRLGTSSSSRLNGPGALAAIVRERRHVSRGSTSHGDPCAALSDDHES